MLHSTMFLARCFVGWMTLLLVAWSTSSTGSTAVSGVDAAGSHQRSELLKMSSQSSARSDLQVSRNRRHVLPNPVGDYPREVNGLSPNDKGNC